MLEWDGATGLPKKTHHHVPSDDEFSQSMAELEAAEAAIA
jgi:hypothetical protein